jgi:hypothetical protein
MPELTTETPYEPPIIEAVLSAEELTREVLYAGVLTICSPDNDC